MKTSSRRRSTSVGKIGFYQVIASLPAVDLYLECTVNFQVRGKESVMAILPNSRHYPTSEHQFILSPKLEIAQFVSVDKENNQTYHYEWKSGLVTSESLYYGIKMVNSELNRVFKQSLSSFAAQSAGYESKFTTVDPPSDVLNHKPTPNELVNEELIKEIGSNQTRLAYCGHFSQAQLASYEGEPERAIFTLKKQSTQGYSIVVFDMDGNILASKEVNLFTSCQINELLGEINWTSTNITTRSFRFCFDRPQVSVVVSIAMEECVQSAKTHVTKDDMRVVLKYLGEELGLTTLETNRLNRLSINERSERLQRLWMLERMQKLDIDHIISATKTKRIKKIGKNGYVSRHYNKIREQVAAKNKVIISSDSSQLILTVDASQLQKQTSTTDLTTGNNISQWNNLVVPSTTSDLGRLLNEKPACNTEHQ